MRVTRIVSSIVATVTSVALLCGTGSIALAANAPVPDNSCSISEAFISFHQKSALQKVVTVGGHFSLSENGELQLDLTDQALRDAYSFTDYDINFIHNDVLDRANGKKSSIASDRANCNGGFYISAADLTTGYAAVLIGAAAIGPDALAAAFVGLSSIVGGPIGGAISGGISLLGKGFFIGLGIAIAGAVAQQKGLCFKFVWKFPPLTVDII